MTYRVGNEYLLLTPDGREYHYRRGHWYREQAPTPGYVPDTAVPVAWKLLPQKARIEAEAGGFSPAVGPPPVPPR